MLYEVNKSWCLGWSRQKNMYLDFMACSIGIQIFLLMVVMVITVIFRIMTNYMLKITKIHKMKCFMGIEHQLLM